MIYLNVRPSNTLTNIYIYLVLILFAFLIGLTIPTLNYTILLLLVAPLLIFFIWKSTLWMLILISLIVFFGDWLISLGHIPEQIMWIHEMIVGVIFIKGIASSLLMKRRIRIVGGWIVFAFIVVSLISALLNKIDIVAILLFLRLVLRYYPLFLGIINLDFKEKHKKVFFSLLFGLIIIQIPVSIIKFFMYGQNEMAIGTYNWRGGVPSTVLPLIVIGFCISYFLLYKKSVVLILLLFGFISFAILGGKRGFIFFLPLLLITIAWYLKNDIGNLFKYIIAASLVFVIAAYFTLSLVPTLSPGRYERSGFYPSHAFNFARQYSTVEIDGIAYGRLASFSKVFKSLSEEGTFAIIFGKGAGNVLKSRFGQYDSRNRAKQEFNIGYGITGITWLAMNVGYIGGFLYFLLFVRIQILCVNLFRISDNSYWRAFGLSMIGFSFLMVLMSLLYANIFVIDLFASHFFCLSAFVVLKEREERLKTNSNLFSGDRSNI